MAGRRNRQLIKAVSRLWNLVDECAEPGWDGNGAEPISRAAAERAVEFVRALPEDIEMPEFAPEPDGCISLDWIRAKSKLISLSIGAGEKIAYAWLDGSDRGHAVAAFDGHDVPWRILEEVKGIVGHPNAAVRAS